jgi:uncharacterized protein with ATP-grasp and redox domains
MLGFDEIAQRDRHARKRIAFLSGADYAGCTPESMGELWELLLRHADSDDPYASVKLLCNSEALKMEQRTREAIRSSGDPFTTALKYAIAGNLIDYGLEHPVTVEEQNRQIDSFAAMRFAIHDSAALKDALKNAKRVLYLCDNAGEIVFDKLLIEQLKRAFPQIEPTFAVKGKAVLNDATRTDALEGGLDSVARVIDNGDGAPGTVLRRTSEAFQAEFAAADIVISKGQGNFESLNNVEKENLFFLFMAKCNSICQVVDAPKMSIICLKSTSA